MSGSLLAVNLSKRGKGTCGHPYGSLRRGNERERSYTKCQYLSGKELDFGRGEKSKNGIQKAYERTTG